MKAIDKSVAAVARLLMYLREPDYLYDFHSCLFSVITGSGVAGWASDHHQSMLWGLMIVIIGLFRVAAVSSASPRLHSASCILSFMSWVFFVCIFIGKGHYVLALVFLNFSVSSVIRYLQLEWWKSPGETIAGR